MLALVKSLGHVLLVVNDLKDGPYRLRKALHVKSHVKNCDV